MADRKFVAGACALAVVAALGVAGQNPANAQGAQAALPSNFPQWAFPGPLLKNVPGSAVKFSDVQMFDRTGAVDWFPNSHPAMPDSVKGRMPLYACGFCHLPQGAGRSENAALAGLPAKYIIEQVADMKSGARKTPDPKFGAAVNMQTTAKMASDADVEAAAKYYASLKYTKHLKLVESKDSPRFTSNGFVYVLEKTGPREALGDRLIEVPDDFEGFEMRDPNMTFTAYVPIGSVARGAVLAKGNGGSRPACETCHGVGLKGSEIGPPIAGRLPTGIFRQLYAFQSGDRNGVTSALMKPIVAGMTQKEMVELAAYASSLEP